MECFSPGLRDLNSFARRVGKSTPIQREFSAPNAVEAASKRYQFILTMMASSHISSTQEGKLTSEVPSIVFQSKKVVADART